VIRAGPPFQVRGGPAKNAETRFTGREMKSALAAAGIAALVVAAGGEATSTAAPANTSPPVVSGPSKVGSTLTVSTGTWTGGPTTYGYQWQRCTATACTSVVGATQRTYLVTSSDVGHALRAVVTATNADGLSTANSNKTAVVPAVSGAPASMVRPSISGDPVVGESLDADTGRWSGSPTSYAYQWLRCDDTATYCFAIAGATGSSYGVGIADVYQTLRVAVTAKNASGVTTAQSAPTAVVQPVVPQVVPGNKRPTIRFRSLIRRGVRVYAHFTVCDDSGRISVIERDAKPRQLAYIRRFAVTTRSCVTATRNWRPAARFRTRGSFVVTLRAVDKSGSSSRFASRSLHWP
jgi:hypothetical protein